MPKERMTRNKKLAHSSSLPKVFYTVLWKSNSPIRVNVLVWIILLIHLNTSDSFIRRCYLHPISVLPSIFLFCFEAAKSMIHLFFGCYYAKHCWESAFQNFNVKWVLSKDSKFITIHFSLFQWRFCVLFFEKYICNKCIIGFTCLL